MFRDYAELMKDARNLVNFNRDEMNLFILHTRNQRTDVKLGIIIELIDMSMQTFDQGVLHPKAKYFFGAFPLELKRIKAEQPHKP